MSFFEKKYMVTGHHGDIYSLTAKQFYERVLNDSKSDYNWIASASELVRICKETSFPTEYALAIKCAILNCFANIEQRANCGGDRYIDKPADQEAVQECYNSLYGVEDEEAVLARRRYLAEIIVTASYTRIFDSHYHPGPTFRKLRKDWNKSKVLEYISKEKIDFKQLVEVLHDEFVEIIKKAEVDGAFEEDERAERENWKKFYEMMRDL